MCVDVDRWIKHLIVLRIDNFQRVTIVMKCFGQCPKNIAVSLVHCAELLLARTFNLQNPSRLTKGDSYFTMHKNLQLSLLLSFYLLKSLLLQSISFLPC
jgi:hypothetical protein